MLKKPKNIYLCAVIFEKFVVKTSLNVCLDSDNEQ